MVFGVFLYFVLVTAVLAIAFLAPVRAWAWSHAHRFMQGGKAAAASALSSSQAGLQQVAHAANGQATQAGRFARRYGKWMLMAISLLVGMPLLALALHQWQQLDGFDHTRSHEVNEQVAALLHGEQLVAPPPLPPELFTTREVEQAIPFAGQASRHWELLDEDFRQRMLLAFKLMREQHGIEMVLLEGYRSPERQAQLAAMGPQVTQAGAFESYHQYGLAADCAFMINGRIVVSETNPQAARAYEQLGSIAKSLGLTWGGDWRSLKDLGHVELSRPGVLRTRSAGATPASSQAH
jgi:peptidoglycan L-alanyl-D-glutamate endopeptidase CwlK